MTAVLFTCAGQREDMPPYDVCSTMADEYVAHVLFEEHGSDYRAGVTKTRFFSEVCLAETDEGLLEPL